MSGHAPAATTSQRIVGYLIDLSPFLIAAAVVGALGASGREVGGASVAPFIGAAYICLRDVTGVSFGKALVGIRVMSVGGAEAGVGQRIVRNVPQALAPVVSPLPVVGLVAALLAGADVLCLLFLGYRIGDKIAGTAVTRRTASAIGANGGL